MTRPPEIEAIRRSVTEFTTRKIKAGQFSKVFTAENSSLLLTMSANAWMRQQYGKPAARALFGSFWFEGELCILFADTNLGKSILAVQIGDSLTKAGSISPFYNQVEEGLSVLYIDFEQSAKQFEARYVDHRWGSYLFADNFYRSEFNPEADNDVVHNNYEDFVKEAMSAEITKTKASVVIIDNITYMRRGTEQAKDALPLMKTLKALKTKFKLSVLVLAHTPKRNPYKPLTVNDLQGSKMLINFADSAFAIGQSHTMPGTRYLKQIKQRNKKEEYGESNICLIRQEKYLNFLRYNFEGYAHEQDHLRRPEKHEQALLKQQVAQLHQAGKTCRQIADELGVHYSTVSRVLQREKMGVNSQL